MAGLFHDPALLALAFATSVFAVFGSVTLAGVVRARRKMRGGVLHVLTYVNGAVALAVLALLALGIDTGAGLVLGIAAGLAAGCFWLVGAVAARARPAWVDLLVIVAVLGYLTTYAVVADGAGTGPRVFPGVTVPAPDAPP